MFDMLGFVVQALFAMALVFGAAFALRYWRSTVPPGADSDCEFANHRRFDMSRALLGRRDEPRETP